MLSDFFVISPRGDTIIAKQYRIERGVDVGAHERSHTEAFFRKIQFWNDEGGEYHQLASNTNHTNPNGSSGAAASSSTEESAGGSGRRKKKGDAPPVFLMPDGLSYIHVKRNGLIFGCTTSRNVSATAVVELLSTIAKVFKDYCGTLSEEAIRKNFILCYELLDELLDYGYPQVTQTENLKAFVYNEPIVVDFVQNTGNMINPKTASANAVHKPVISSVNVNGRKTGLHSNQKNEIFVDILERLNICFSSNGYILNSTIDGCIQMKSYLAGNPELRLALNEDLVVGRQNAGTYGSVVVDDINFNSCVNLTEFDHARTLSFVPPDGEFVVLNYRMTGEFRAPFRIFPSLEELSPTKLELTLMIRAEIPNNHFGANVSVECPLPSASVAAVSSQVVALAPGASTSSSHADYQPNTGKLVWSIKKFPGATEMTLKTKITLSEPCTTLLRRQIGPINMSFEIPMYNVSSLQVRYLRIAENMPGYTPYRWVRYVTQSNSYVCRL